MTQDISPEVVDYLAHYGVKGMKWGVRKDPDKAPRRRSVKKAERQERLAKDKSEWTDEDRAAERNRKIKIGLVVAGTALAAYGTYRLVDSGEYRTLAAKGANLVGKSFGEWKRNAANAGPKSAEDIFNNIIPKINPELGKMGSRNNCRRATFAYEMSRRGYDVSATRSTRGYGQSHFGLVNALRPGEKNLSSNRVIGIVQGLYRGGKTPEGAASYLEGIMKMAPERVFKFDSKAALDALLDGSHDGSIDVSGSERTAQVMNWIKKQPAGARGELSMIWSAGGGHSMAWENVNGKAHIFDAQLRKHFAEGDGSFDTYAQRIGDMSAMRLDNLDLDENFLKRWIK